MPMGSILLKPGIDVEKTLSLNEAGFSGSQLVRFKNGLVQPCGGWVSYGSVVIPSTVRDLHAWQGISGDTHLGVGAVDNLIVVTNGSNADITPQEFLTTPTPSFSVSSGSNTITVTDPESGPSIFNTVFFLTPVALGNLLLNGAYDVVSVLSTGSYQIVSSIAATTTISSGGILPVFNSTANSPIVTVTLPNHGLTPVVGLREQFLIPTTLDGLTITGQYVVSSIIDSTEYTITATMQASATATSTMNGGAAGLLYYVTAGPPSLGTAYGAGAFGAGTFGGVGGGFTPSAGVAVGADDWSLDNWGEVFLACPKDGAVFVWSPDSGFTNAQVVSEAPFFNGGLFVSMPQQILVLWKSTTNTGVQDNLIVRWSDAEDYTNWTVSNQTAAGSFHIPTGSVIIGGLQAPNYGVIWTDIDVWLMQYVGGDVIFNFTRVGAGCGLIGQHAAGVLAGSVWWCGQDNFFTITANGVKPIPCTVWDYIFQNIDRDNAHKVRCAPNSAFNEIGWFFPSLGVTENDSYVKYNIVEDSWDYGILTRTAWIDVSVLGNPIAVDSGGVLYQHEEGESTAGTGAPTFLSGWWALTEGNDIAFVDYVIPDFKFGFLSDAPDAEILVTFYSTDYPGGTAISYGPYTVTSTTQYLTPRIRGRLMAVLVQSNNERFWRLGKIRFRYALSGRR